MSKCPVCEAPVLADFGLIECESCGVQLLVHVDGRVEHQGAEGKTVLGVKGEDENPPLIAKRDRTKNGVPGFREVTRTGARAPTGEVYFDNADVDGNIELEGKTLPPLPPTNEDAASEATQMRAVDEKPEHGSFADFLAEEAVSENNGAEEAIADSAVAEDPFAEQPYEASPASENYFGNQESGKVETNASRAEAPKDDGGHLGDLGDLFGGEEQAEQASGHSDEQQADFSTPEEPAPAAEAPALEYNFDDPGEGGGGEPPPPVYMSAPSDSPDLSDLARFGNSDLSGGRDGALRYTLFIEGIDTSDVRAAFREAMTDRKFAWDIDTILRSVKNGEVKIQNVAPSKAYILISRLRNLPVKVRWEQYALSQT